jgi:hypothetical protein
MFSHEDERVVKFTAWLILIYVLQHVYDKYAFVLASGGGSWSVETA